MKYIVYRRGRYNVLGASIYRLRLEIGPRPPRVDAIQRRHPENGMTVNAKSIRNLEAIHGAKACGGHPGKQPTAAFLTTKEVLGIEEIQIA